MTDDDPGPGFRLADADAGGPLVLSIPHAGRAYPSDLSAALRAPLERLLVLEDRHVDLLAEGIGAPALIATRPRLWIDLNRGETELDPDMVAPRPASSWVAPSPKMRGGLGLIPRRLAGVGDLWRDRLSVTEVKHRIERDHRPYHATLERLLARARARHGIAILVDLHSMPPLAAGARPPPRLVTGDRFGRSAAARFTAQITDVARAHGLASAENSPYAGGYIVDRHGAPRNGIHAIQIEIDRSLYLAPGLTDLDQPGVARMRRVLRESVAALADEALGGTAIAAE